MPLPLPYVERIHQRLTIRYGSAWSAKWAGVDQSAIQADWAEQLDGMAPENIRRALESLPDDFPPTATAFRKLGHIRAESETLTLPAPDPAGLKRIASSMTQAQSTVETPTEWMARLERDVLAGNASKARRDHYRIAVANGYYGGGASQVGGEFVRPAPETLPAGMRVAA